MGWGSFFTAPFRHTHRAVTGTAHALDQITRHPIETLKNPTSPFRRDQMDRSNEGARYASSLGGQGQGGSIDWEGMARTGLAAWQTFQNNRNADATGGSPSL